MLLELPAPIYEENIMSLTYVSDTLKLTYEDEEHPGRYHCLVFTNVYWYEFTDFELISILDWKFGLELLEPDKSEILNGKLKSILERKTKESRYISLDELKHYRLVVDDYGEIDIIAQSVEIVSHLQTMQSEKGFRE